MVDESNTTRQPAGILGFIIEKYRRFPLLNPLDAYDLQNGQPPAIDADNLIKLLEDKFKINGSKLLESVITDLIKDVCFTIESIPVHQAIRKLTEIYDAKEYTESLIERLEDITGYEPAESIKDETKALALTNAFSGFDQDVEGIYMMIKDILEHNPSIQKGQTSLIMNYETQDVFEEFAHEGTIRQA